MILDWLHEQHETADGRAVLFECTECGYRSQSLGSLHAHVEGHWSLQGALSWHVTHVFQDDPAAKWMDYTRILAVDSTETVELEDVRTL